MLKLLIDMDQVLYDFVGGVNACLPPDIEPTGDPATYWFFESYPPEQRRVLFDIANKEGFFYGLPLYPDAQLSVMGLAERGYDIWFVSTPLKSNPLSASEKMKAVVRDFGKSFADRLVLVHDKTLVRGNILIDDKPDISGCYEPAWTQVFFDHKYNRDKGGYRLYNWHIDHVVSVLEGIKSGR